MCLAHVETRQAIKNNLSNSVIITGANPALSWGSLHNVPHSHEAGGAETERG